MKKTSVLGVILLALLMIIAFTGCDKNKLNIHFETNGGREIAPLATDGKSVVDLPKPTREGYIFEGWFYDNYTFREEFTNSSLVDTPIKKDVTVYAKWRI